MVCLWVYRQTVRAGNIENPFIALHIAVTVAFQPPFGYAFFLFLFIAPGYTSVKHAFRYTTPLTIHIILLINPLIATLLEKDPII